MMKHTSIAAPPMTVGGALAQARRIDGVTATTAQAILAHVTGRNRSWMLAHAEALLTSEQLDRFAVLLERAAQGEPLAYLTSEREFYGLAFAVTPDVLIPRPETEGLVDVALKWSERSSLAAPWLVDVGTGSGAIAVALAVHLPQARMMAVDVSLVALDVARHNAARYGAEQRIHFVQGSLLENLPGPFDAILANLPYIPTSTLRTLDVSRWEPSLALDGGPDGLELVRRLIWQAATRLRPGGLLALEIQHDQGSTVADLFQEAFPTANVIIQRDLSGLERIVWVETPVSTA